LVFDVPLLIEAGTRWRAQVDRVWVVDCLVETQIQRVVARSGLSPEAVQKIIATQSSRAEKLRAADWVIYNEGLTIEALQEAVGQLPIRTLEAH
jgi:dephospho-CoA kinase